MNLIALLFVLNGIIMAQGGPGEFSFANIYSSNMVLQKAPARAKIWGYAEEIGRTIIIGFQDILYAVPTLIGPDGNVTWSVLLRPTQPGGPYDITAKLGKRRIQLTEILFGDIWFCSGQSNMAYSVGALDNPERELANAGKYHNIRLFQAAFSYSNELQSEAHIARNWEQPSRESVKKFSAVCWLFGRKLYRHLGYPIGLIKSAYPGSRIEAWMSTKTLEKCFPDGVPEWTRAEDFAHNQPSVLWNAMVNPFLPLSIKGAIWYQGEWNRNNSADYDYALSNMVADWRKTWFAESGRTMDKTFPFGQVQLHKENVWTISNFSIGENMGWLLAYDLVDQRITGVKSLVVGSYKKLAPWRHPNNSDSDLSFPAVRWAQTFNLGYTPNKALPKVFTAVAMDLPDFDSPYGDIHPRYKRAIADRLVVGALNEAYGWTVNHQGPFPSDFLFDDLGSLLIIYNSSTDLVFRNFNNEVIFEICCSLTVNECSLLDNVNWFPAEILDTGRAGVTIAVPCTTPASAAAIRYAWRESPCPHGIENCTIYSKKSENSPLNLPAPPFYIERANRT